MAEETEEIKEVEEKEDSEVKKAETDKKHNHQLFWIIGLMAAVILIMVLIPIVKHELFDKFEFMNLDFEKTLTGDAIFYTTNIPVVENDEVSGSYLMYFRNDPRELENISIDENIENEGIKFIKNKVTYVSIDPNMNSCQENSVALFMLGNFLKDFGISAKSAFSDPDYIDSEDFPYITCDNSKSNTVIMIESGEETKIERKIGNCYVISFKDCEIQQGVERFILLILKDYMGYFERA